LPKLNKKLVSITCCYNEISTLPPFNEDLVSIKCSHNYLTRLPPFNENLLLIDCSYNYIFYITQINDMLKTLTYSNNEIYEVIDSYNMKIIKDKNKIINQFKMLYYSLRLKHQLRDWLWKRVREPKIKQYYSPENLMKLLNKLNNENDEDELDEVVNMW